MDLRHLDTLLAIDEFSSFTAAADAMHTVQSNVSDTIRQLESELGVTLLVRNKRGATATEFGLVVLERARRIHNELAALREDVSMLLGLEAGHATFGVVGTVSRWLVPELVATLRVEAPGVKMRINEGASERLAEEVASREIAQAVITEKVSDSRLVSEHLLNEELVAVVPASFKIRNSSAITLEVLSKYPMILPPTGNPMREEIQASAEGYGLKVNVPVEIEGVRLIADLVAAGAGVSIIPTTAVPPDTPGILAIPIPDLPPRRLALVTAKGSQLSMADAALREVVLRIVRRTH